MLVTCTNCQSKIKVPDAAAGKKGKCPKCGTIITIPALGAVDEPAPAPAEAPAGGSPFDFDAPPPAPAKKGRKPADEEVDDDVVGADDDEAKPGKKKEEAQVLSIVALVLGILSLVCGCGSTLFWYCAPLPFLMAIGAIVTGLMGMKRGGRTMGMIGAILGGVSILLTIVAIIVGIFFGAMILGAANLGAIKAGQ
jgi:predicted Zn finger-like uncharacterized protein